MSNYLGLKKQRGRPTTQPNGNLCGPEIQPPIGALNGGQLATTACGPRSWRPGQPCWPATGSCAPLVSLNAKAKTRYSSCRRLRHGADPGTTTNISIADHSDPRLHRLEAATIYAAR